MSDHFESSDDDLEDVVGVLEIPKSIRYFEEVVPEFTDKQFLEHFRINKQKVQELADRFEESEYYNYQECATEKITSEKFIIVFLWFAANEASSYRDVADRFNISKSTLFKVIRRVSYFLSNLSTDLIKWPTENEKLEAEQFFRTKGFPGAIGAIDGTHIRIDKPADDPDSYLNRKHFFSIQAQIVCDHNKRIIDIFVGYPGSVHDSRVLRLSPLHETLQEKCGDFFILGDSGYPCLQNLLTPFKDTGHLSRRQRNYNLLLSKNRYIIEHCFGLLKQKFRQLYHIKLKIIPDVVHFIRACAVLHNISLSDEFIMENNGEEENIQNPIERHDVDDMNGNLQRVEVMNRLNFII